MECAAHVLPLSLLLSHLQPVATANTRLPSADSVTAVQALQEGRQEGRQAVRLQVNDRSNGLGGAGRMIYCMQAMAVPAHSAWVWTPSNGNNIGNNCPGGSSRRRLTNETGSMPRGRNIDQAGQGMAAEGSVVAAGHGASGLSGAAPARGTGTARMGRWDCFPSRHVHNRSLPTIPPCGGEEA